MLSSTVVEDPLLATAVTLYKVKEVEDWQDGGVANGEPVVPKFCIR